MANDKFILPQLAKHDPALVQAGLLAQRLGFRLGFREDDDPRDLPPVVADDALMSDAATYHELAKLAAASGQILRAASLRPTSLEMGRSLKFTDDQIRESVFPFLQAGVSLSEAEVEKQRAVLAATEADAAAARERAAVPLDDLTRPSLPAA